MYLNSLIEVYDRLTKKCLCVVFLLPFPALRKLGKCMETTQRNFSFIDIRETMDWPFSFLVLTYLSDRG